MAAMKVTLALCVLFAVASANEFVGGDIVHLTSSNYDDVVRIMPCLTQILQASGCAGFDRGACLSAG